MNDSTPGAVVTAVTLSTSLTLDDMGVIDVSVIIDTVNVLRDFFKASGSVVFYFSRKSRGESSSYGFVCAAGGRGGRDNTNSKGVKDVDVCGW